MQGRVFLYALAIAALVACGGGGGGAPAVVTPVATATPIPSPTTATVQFTIGQQQAIQSVRRLQYLSPHTQSVVVVYGNRAYGVNFIQGSTGCTGAVPNLVCTVQFDAPTGSDTFQIIAYDQNGGAGQELSKTQITVNVVAGVNKVSAVLDGVPTSANVQKAINLPEGVATSVPIAVTAYDADGSAIVGPGNYTAPIALTDTDTSGGTTVTSSVGGPSAQASVTYDGTSTPAANAYVIAQAGNLTSQYSLTGFLRVVPQYTEYGTPSNHSVGFIAAAPDGSLWTIEGGTPFGQSMILVHINANGTATEIPLSMSLGQGVASMIVGNDGALWCLSGPMYGAATAEMLRIDASGNVTTYTDANLSTYMGRIGMALGPDNRVWFVQHGGIGAIDTSGNFMFYPSPTTPSGLTASFNDITLGPDGNLWATDGSQGGIVRVTTSGAMTYFVTAGVTPVNIAKQANSFIVTSSSSPATLYQLDTSGNVQKTYTLSNFPSANVTAASNGSVWIPTGTDIAGGSTIARLGTSGVLSRISIPYPNDPGNGSPEMTFITSAADGSMWYVRNASYGKIVVH